MPDWQIRQRNCAVGLYHLPERQIPGFHRRVRLHCLRTWQVQWNDGTVDVRDVCARLNRARCGIYCVHGMFGGQVPYVTHSLHRLRAR